MPQISLVQRNGVTERRNRLILRARDDRLDRELLGLPLRQAAGNARQAAGIVAKDIEQRQRNLDTLGTAADCAERSDRRGRVGAGPAQIGIGDERRIEPQLARHSGGVSGLEIGQARQQGVDLDVARGRPGQSGELLEQAGEARDIRLRCRLEIRGQRLRHADGRNARIAGGGIRHVMEQRPAGRIRGGGAISAVEIRERHQAANEGAKREQNG